MTTQDNPAWQQNPSTGVEVREVVRSFGSVLAVDHLSLRCEPGQVTALVGPNGSGKTTLLLMLATLLQPDSGEIRIEGLNPVGQPTEVRRRIGWMPDSFGTWDTLTVTEVLHTVAAAYRLTEEQARARVAELIAALHLEEIQDRRARVLSRGQRQRLGLARALVHSPSVLLLDEPAAGLDPRSRIHLRDLVRDLASSGCTVVISSHILTELEELADRAIIVDNGRRMATHDLTADRIGTRRWRITTLSGTRLRAALRATATPFLEVPMPDGNWSDRAAVDVEVADEGEAAALLEALVGEGVPVFGFAVQPEGLTAAYLAATGEER